MINWGNIFSDLPEDPAFRALLESWAVEETAAQSRDWAVIESLLKRAVTLGRRDWEALLRLFLHFNDLIPTWFEEPPPGSWGTEIDLAVQPIFGREDNFLNSTERTPAAFLECLNLMLIYVGDFLFVRSLPYLLGGKLETP